MSNIKQVIVMRKDLNMRKGKMIAQGAHASLKVFADLMTFGSHGDIIMYGMNVTDAMKEWLNGSFTKICVSVDSEQELLDVYEKARSAGIISSLIEDAGHTEFGGVPTFTCCAIGPDTNEKIDEITGKLKLL